MAENIKVAVRVRPFYGREVEHNSKLIIQMNGNQTTITDAKGQKKSFAFDYSYWSHDGFKVRQDGYFEPDSPRYADQKRVFNDLGRGILDNAWKGYNCSLFAYGQTGSGKSYSIIGYGANKGVVPIVCEELFAAIEQKRSAANAGEEWQVSLSMVEIYNETVRDLLVSTKAPKGGLNIRQHQTKGFYIEGLTAAPVSNYAQIESKIAEGSHNRSVAATNMNATSSRAHTIVAINFTQKTRDAGGQNMTKTSVMNLVDLAGSERVGLTGATGERMKEGAAINLSLTMLGNCIKALADQAAGNTRVVVPFRDSKLTKLLQNALGGNSKTVMIAALSPAEINYEETLSTLRFADRAKSIKTRAVVNESPTDKLIRELREENARLMALLKSGGTPTGGDAGEGKEEAEQRVRELMKKNQEEMETMEKTWQERLAKAQGEVQQKIREQEERNERKKNVPHLWNLNEDAALSGMIVYFCDPGSMTVGREGNMQLSGVSIRPRHAVVKNDKGKVTVTPLEAAKVYVNGKEVAQTTELHHNDRVLFGNNHLYIFHHPVDYAKQAKAAGGAAAVATPTFEEAQAELATNSGVMGLLGDSGARGDSEEYMLLKDDLVRMFPEVQEANAMSQELDKRVRFELLLMSPQGRGLREGEGRTEVYVKLINLNNQNEFLWPKDQFSDRKYLMRDMYNTHMEGYDGQVPPEQDPFWESPDTPVLLGTSYVYLESLAHLIEASQSFAVMNYRGEDQGKLLIEVVPCDADWNEQRDSFSEPDQLVGKALNFKIKVLSGKDLPARFVSFFCRYKYYLDDGYTETAEVGESANPQFGFEKTYACTTVTEQFLDYLQHSYIIVELWGRQRDTGAKAGKSTKDLAKATKPVANAGAVGAGRGGAGAAGAAAGGTGGAAAGDPKKLKAELESVTKEKEKAENKVKQLQMMLNDAKKKGSNNINVDVLDKTLSGAGGSGGGGGGSGQKKTSGRTPDGNSPAVQQKRDAAMGQTTSKACSIQ